MLMGAMADLAETPLHDLSGDALFVHFRPRFHGTLIANVGMTQTRSNQLLSDDAVDLVAYGQAFIANPDLPERFATHAPLAVADPATFYGELVRLAPPVKFSETEPYWRDPVLVVRGSSKAQWKDS
jgi:N-ethylmaleimide reductase